MLEEIAKMRRTFAFVDGISEITKILRIPFDGLRTGGLWVLLDRLF